MQIILSDYSFFEASIELSLIINRIAARQEIGEFYAETVNEIHESEKYEFSSQLMHEIAGRHNLDISNEEICYFAECLRGKSYLKDHSRHSSAFDVRVMIAEALYQISRSFGIDFYLDFALYDLLVAHMRSAVYRIQTGETLKNPLKDSLLKAYPEIFEIIRKNVGTLEKNIGGNFSEDELSFMVLYFASVLEREKAESKKTNKIKVALVCETGRGTAQFMMAKLRALDDLIEIVSVSSVHNTLDVKNSGAQMIISTIPIEKMDIPCMTVRSAILSKEDLLDVRGLAMEILDLSAEQKADVGSIAAKTEEISVQGAFYDLLSVDRMQIGYEATDWEDAVRRSGELLLQAGVVEERYVDAMVNNIKKYGPYIVICPGTALSHADALDGAIEEAASFVRLKEPITFGCEGNDPVVFVIGMSILSADSINQAIYDLMLIFGNEKTREHLAGLVEEREVLEAIRALNTADQSH